MSKKSKSVIAIYLIILIIYVLAFLMIPFSKSTASWISFAFTIIAIGFGLYTFKLSFNKGDKFVSKIYGYPIFRISYIYLIAQIVIGIVICVIATFIAVPYWIALLTSIILLAFALIGVIVMDNTRDLVEELDAKVEAQTKTITYFKVDIDSIVNYCNDESIRKKLEKLSEDIRFSDPVSSDETLVIENEITDKIAVLRNIIISGSIDEINEIIRDITNTLARRNHICKISKR